MGICANKLVEHYLPLSRLCSILVLSTHMEDRYLLALHRQWHGDFTFGTIFFNTLPKIPNGPLTIHCSTKTLERYRPSPRPTDHGQIHRDGFKPLARTPRDVEHVYKKKKKNRLIRSIATVARRTRLLGY